MITTVAGGGTDYDDDRGDNGAATSATLSYPNGIALGDIKSIYISFK